MSAAAATRFAEVDLSSSELQIGSPKDYSAPKFSRHSVGSSERTKLLEQAYSQHARFMDAWFSLLTRIDVVTVSDYWALCVSRFAQNDCLMRIATNPKDSTECESKLVTYTQVDELSNQVAHWALSCNLHLQPENESVCLLMENSCEFIWTWLGLAKVGCTVALLNTSWTPDALWRAVQTAKSHTVIVSARYDQVWRAAQSLYESNVSTASQQPLRVLYLLGTAKPQTSNAPLQYADALIQQQPKTDANFAHHRSHLHRDSPQFLIFTSGTTGTSKAALFSHRRFIGAALTWSDTMTLQSEDRFYDTLPLFHGNGGVCAVGAAWHAGALLAIRDKFSVSAFWSDVRRLQLTAMFHVGELWSYLASRPPQEDDDKHSLRTIAGNGLTATTWRAVTQRFGISHVVEHYGLSEMPASAHLNFYGQTAACGYIPPALRKQTRSDVCVRFDAETGRVVRKRRTDSPPEAQPADGFCEEVKTGESGEMLFRLAPGYTPSQTQQSAPLSPHVPSDSVSHSSDEVNPHYCPYRGYTSDAASLARVYRSVFELNDAWFATGDSLRFDEEGICYFVDRLGDTFRWKGENVSCADVQQAILAFDSKKLRIVEAQVYGVELPERQGKAGMGMLTLARRDERNQESSDGSLESHLREEPNSSALVSEFTSDQEMTLFVRHLRSSLPHFAVPILLRLSQSTGSSDASTSPADASDSGTSVRHTSTLKFTRFRAVREGFDPSYLHPPCETLLLLSAASQRYTPLTATLHAQMLQPNYREFELTSS